MSLCRHVDGYLNFLAVEKRVSLNTLEAYSRDLNRYIDFVEQAGIMDIRDTSSDMIISFLGNLKRTGLATTSINRSLAALRGLYKYLLAENVLDENPVAPIELVFSVSCLVNSFASSPGSLKSSPRPTSVQLLWQNEAKITNLRQVQNFCIIFTSLLYYE